MKLCILLAVSAALSALFSGCSLNSQATSEPAVVAAAAYEGKIIRLSGDSGIEAAKIYVVRKGQKQWVTSGEWLTNHGYKIPNDVVLVQRSVLDTIPEGPFISEPK